MMISNHDQLMRLLYCAGCGVLLGGYYELFRLWRRLARPPRWKRFVSDIVYCLTSGMMAFLFSLAVQNGVWDAWMFLGFAVGMTVWRQTIGRLTPFLCTVLRRVGRAVHRGYVKIDTLCRKTVKKVGIFLKKGLHTLRRLVYNQV